MTPRTLSLEIPQVRRTGPSVSSPLGLSRQAVALLLFPALALTAAEPVLSRDDAAFLHGQARKIVASARLAAGSTSGKWRNTTPYAVHVPGGNMGYPAFWIRDAAMMLGADFVPSDEVEGWIRLMASTIRRDTWNVHPGAVVPAYAVPDHINFDGLPVFYPGTYDSGAGQGGHPFGKYPPLDDHFYFIGSVFEHWRLTRSTSLFRSNISTAAGEMPLAALCERVYLVAQSDPATGLVVAGPVDTENAKDWGFCDTVFKSGKLLIPSVLKHNAARQLTALFAAAGDTVRSRHYAAEARRLRQAITKTFSRSNGRGDGWLRSATGIGNQPDVWGTAFAVWSGAVEGAAARNASRALAAAYRKRTAVCDGSVRHILTTDPANHGLWQQCIAKPGTYQNGGYWSTPTGWYIAAVHLTDPPAARALATEFVRSLRENRRPDGLSQAWEWLNPDTGERSNPLYVASVALPYISLAQAGLIPHPPRP